MRAVTYFTTLSVTEYEYTEPEICFFKVMVLLELWQLIRVHAGHNHDYSTYDSFNRNVSVLFTAG
jgi:hypothetical protein